jgi:hypothetical protein
MLPKISFCIPTFNNAAYLAQCIDSVLGQDYANTEIVVVNDCSTDQTLEVLSSYADAVSVIDNPFNHGQAVATNQAITAATGEYCVILHSDDYLLPAFTRELPAILTENTNVGLAVGERRETDADDQVQELAPFYDGDYIIPGRAQAEVFMFMSFLPCQVLIRKSLLHDINLLDPRYEVNLDGLLWFKCALEMDVAYIQAPVSSYRRHAQSTSGKLNQAPEHIAKIYATLKEMHRVGRENNLSAARYQESEQRLGEIALKYAPDALLGGHVETAGVYLKFARLFDEEIVTRSDYQLIHSSLNSGIQDDETALDALCDKLATHARQHSYSPPPGATPLTRTAT